MVIIKKIRSNAKIFLNFKDFLELEQIFNRVKWKKIQALANGVFDQSDKHPIVCYTIGKVSYSSEFCINLLDYILPQSIQIINTTFEN